MIMQVLYSAAGVLFRNYIAKKKTTRYITEFILYTK